MTRKNESKTVLLNEFRRLQKLVPMDEITGLQWLPGKRIDISGEVKGDTIYVYDNEPYEALSTLRHEYLDCLLTRRLIEPLVSIVNALTKVRENEIYRGKERIVNLLSAAVGTTSEAT